MIDLNRWIYSKDIASWLAKGNSLDLEAQIDCICAAPHRTLEEKLEGVKGLKAEYGEKGLEDKIKTIALTLNRSRSDIIEQSYLFGIEIYYRGEKDYFLPNMIFRTAKEAEDEISQRIETAAEENHLERKHWYGVVKVFQKAGSLRCFIHTENFAVRYDGEVIYVQKSYNDEGWFISSEIGMEDFSYLKIAYPSGTIVSIMENPFFSSMKGILVNATEPEEENFSDDPYNQWLIYPTSEHVNQTHGIGCVNLRDDYMPFENSPDFIFPYKQFIDVYKGKLEENETWLSELSGLIKADKSCMRKILYDRKPKNSNRMSIKEERLTYIRKLVTEQ